MLPGRLVLMSADSLIIETLHDTVLITITTVYKDFNFLYM
jgi:hypothetical protein